ncbi:MAG: phosphate acyltransferase, partial [Bryobacteraceae bacterium]
MPDSATLFLARQIERLRRLPRKRIVFPEGSDPRVQSAAERLRNEGLIDPILLHNGPYNTKYAHIYYH